MFLKIQTLREFRKASPEIRERIIDFAAKRIGFDYPLNYPVHLIENNQKTRYQAYTRSLHSFTKLQAKEASADEYED